MSTLPEALATAAEFRSSREVEIRPQKMSWTWVEHPTRCNGHLPKGRPTQQLAGCVPKTARPGTLQLEFRRGRVRDRFSRGLPSTCWNLWISWPSSLSLFGLLLVCSRCLFSAPSRPLWNACCCLGLLAAVGTSVRVIRSSPRCIIFGILRGSIFRAQTSSRSFLVAQCTFGTWLCKSSFLAWWHQFSSSLRSLY